jgi:hypothetical protein
MNYGTRSHLDQKIGSVLEAWLLEGVEGACQFCREPLGPDDETVTEGKNVFCTEDCRDNWKTVFDARTAIGKRDLEQRGFD